MHICTLYELKNIYKNTKMGKKDLLLIRQNEEKRGGKKPDFRQLTEKGVVQVGALRGQEGANGARRGRKTKVSTVIL